MRLQKLRCLIIARLLESPSWTKTMRTKFAKSLPAGTFSVQLVSSSTRWHYREDGKLPAHDKVLRPLLKVATECWAYGIKPASDVYLAASDILERDKGRYRICLEGDPVGGHELFWNAHGGKRGTIVILVPRLKFDAEAIFRGGHEAFVVANFRTGHTPAAIRFRASVSSLLMSSPCVCRATTELSGWTFT